MKRWYKWQYLPLLLCLLIALLLRVWLVVHTQGVLDGDEAMTGIQAERILQGERPIYFYSQAYMGSLEAYLIAGFFALFGPLTWALRAEPVLLSLGVVWASWRFAGSLADLAHLPSQARQYFRTLVALGVAIVPLYDAVVELRALGGYIETFLLMLLLLDAAVRLTQRWSAGGKLRELLWHWAVIGALIGLGFWIDPLIVSAVAAAAIWIAGYCCVELLGWNGVVKLWSVRYRSVLKGLGAAIIALPAACIGGWPALLWGASHNWENMTFLLQRNNGFSLHTMHILSNLYIGCVAPRVVGGALPGERPLLLLLHALPLALGLCCIALSALLIVASLLWRHPLLIEMRSLLLLPMLFAGLTYFFFLKSWGPEFCFNRDTIGRYATPLALMLPIFIAAIFTFLTRFFAIGGKIWKIFPPIAKNLVVIPLLVVLVAQVGTYALTNPGLTFQSPFCRDAPALNEPVIAYMQREHIHDAWAISWVSYPIMFKTNSAIVMADPGPVVNHASFTHLGRLPQEDQLLTADRPSLLVFVDPADKHPALLQLLDKLHITYHAAIFPSEPGVALLVVTPLNRTVNLQESDAFKTIFTACPSRWGADIKDV